MFKWLWTPWRWKGRNISAKSCFSAGLVQNYITSCYVWLQLQFLPEEIVNPKYPLFRDLTVKFNEVNAEYVLTNLLLNWFKKQRGDMGTPLCQEKMVVPLFHRQLWQRLCVLKLGAKSQCVICQHWSCSLEGLAVIFNLVTSLWSKHFSFLISEMIHYGYFLFWRKEEERWLIFINALPKGPGPAHTSDM